LGVESSVVTPLNPQVDRIDGGAIRGANLFHSFQEFNVGEGQGTYFANPAGIENILTRVTGTNASNILGTLGVTGGSANLFLINPNGIIFGQNARLDVGGSFVATTANAVGLANGDIFSANRSSPLPTGLLNVNPNAFFFNQIVAQPIINRSTADSRGLEVPQGQSLLLVGGNVSLEGGQILAPGGRVELGGLAGSGAIELNVDGNNLRLNFPDGIARADVSFTNGAQVNVRAGGGGNIAVNVQNLNLAGRSTLRAGIASGLGSIDSKAGDIEIDATGAITLTDAESFISNAVLSNAIGKGGNVHITTQSLSVSNGAQVFAGTSGQGDAGSVNINVRDTASFDGVSGSRSSGAYSTVITGAVGQGGNVSITAGALRVTNGAQLETSTSGQGDVGSVNVNVRDAVSFDGDRVEGSNVFSSGAYSRVEAGAVGQAGSVNLVAESLSVTNGAVLTTSTDGKGNAGSVNINVRDTVSFDGEGSFNRDVGFRQSSGAYSSVKRNAEGQGGRVNLMAGALSVTNGAALVTSTLGQGDAGSVNLNLRETASFDGVGPDFFSSGAYSRVEDGAVGQGGSVNLTAESLSVTNGAVLTTSTDGKGNAGSVNINVRDIVSFDGQSRFNGQSIQPSGAFSSVRSRGVGRGGSIHITTGSLSVTNGAELIVNTYGQGNAGSIQVSATDSVNLSGVSPNGFSSGLFTATEEEAGGQGGEIGITTDTLRLSNGAVLSARTRSTYTGGDVIVDASTLEVTGGGQILTTAFSSGHAGKIALNVTDNIILVGSDPTYPDRLAQFGRPIVDSVDTASGVFADTSDRSTGQGGDLTIQTRNLVVRDGAKVNVSSPGLGDAGSLRVEADLLFLDNQGRLTGTTASGIGGNMTLQVQDLILMRNGSVIATTAENNGSGGNITINSPLIVAVPEENSDIIANADQGPGGQIEISADGIYGLEYRDRLTLKSDINASSNVEGLNGVVEINTPDVDPSRGLANLPVEPTDPEVAQGCRADRSQAQSEFVITGRGGLPPNPSEALSSDAVEVDLVTLNSSGENPSRPTAYANPTHPTPAPIIEAQGWVINPLGEVVLTATAPNVTPDSSWHRSVECRAQRASG
jgi:filamentous hemagglutinin family protein